MLCYVMLWFLSLLLFSLSRQFVFVKLCQQSGEIDLLAARPYERS